MLFLFSTLLSVITIITMWLAGNNDKRAWILGLANQALWVIFIIITNAWGLLLLTASLVFVYIRNLRRWNQGPYSHKFTNFDDLMEELSEDTEYWNYEDDGKEA